MESSTLKNLLLVFVAFISFAGFAQEYVPFQVRYQNNLKGDLTFIANNIVNRDGGTSTTEPEDAYDNQNTNTRNRSWNRDPETGGFFNVNDYKDMQYIDVDGDPSTFSSSTATFDFADPSCNAIRYAGLYWSGTYPSATANGSYDGSTYIGNTIPVGQGRQNDFNQVRLRVPGGTYVDITADDIIYDGFTSTDPSMQENSPYACYADVTALIAPLANPAGDYTVANVRSVTGSLTPGGGAAAGWTLVIVYENPNLSGKLITTFDGFARVNSSNSNVTVNYNGFTTIPVGPVNASLGVAALEGDFRIDGDQLEISASSIGTFSNISDTANPIDNFFNSNISLNGSVTTNRTPNSINTLGYDTDMFLLSNPNGNVIPNNETAATFRFTSDGDQYYPFFNSFNVEIIEPNIVLEKRVEDIGGNDITGQGVNLGQLLDYVLSFENIGNDDATNYTIRDILPINVTLDELNLTLPAGVTYTYDPITREVIFSIPDNLVEEGDPLTSIRMRVQVAENCFDFIDACTDLIQNLAYSTYQGVINNNQITDDPSVSDFDNCGFVTPGATNFLLDDLENCDFSRTVELCGNTVVLDAGDNFDEYIWYRDNNADGLIDAGDTVITDGDPDNDPSTLLVSDAGTYIVDKIVADPCKGFEEIITVIPFGSTLPNPITQLINDTTNTVEGQILVCPNDGEELPEIFLCGLNDTELIEINIPDAASIQWQQLDEASCPPIGDDCANKNSACTWNTIDTGFDFTASDAGEYRVLVNYQNGCSARFYFNIYKNPLNPQYNKQDIICTTPGNITVTNMPADYEYQLINATNGNIIVPFSAGNGPSFDIATNGAYTVQMRQLGVVGGCIFMLENIGILTRDFQVEIDPNDATCSGLGSIEISALDVEPQYYYEIAQGGTIIDSSGPGMDNNYTFENVNPGIYDVTVTTDDGCTETRSVEVIDSSDLELTARVSQHISCKEGNILMESDGGKTPHTYAIWSFVDEGGITQISYPTPADIPASAFQTSQIFDILVPGIYTFVVVDRFNCFDISNAVVIELVPAVEVGSITFNDVLCFGDSTGSIVTVIDDYNGYQVTFELLDEDDNVIDSNSSGIFNGLAEGEYTIVMYQRKGSATCIYEETNTIGGPTAALFGEAEILQLYTCLQTGTIQAQNVSGGTAPYEYSIDGVTFGGSDTFTGLTPGTYTITIRDANNCIFITEEEIIPDVDSPDDLTFTGTALTCPAVTSDVTATVTNGTAPFVIEIIAPSPIAASSSSGNTATFNGLGPDTYTFLVTDANGCTYQENYTIGTLTLIDVAGQWISDVSCVSGNDGEASFTISGFTTSYDYSITGPLTFSGTAETSTTVPLTNLVAGTYTITVTDNDTNCVATDSVTISEPTTPLSYSETITQPSCTADGSIVLTATGGWGSYTYTLLFPDGTTSVNNTTGVFNGLTQTGTYNLTVADANGCEETGTINLIPAVPPVLEVVPNDICYDDLNGLTLTANIISGGTAPFLFRINNGPYDTNNAFSGLNPGTYTIDVIDSKNCTDSVSITIDPELSVTAIADPITACTTDTDIVITAAGGDGNYVYAVVVDGATPLAGDFTPLNTVTVTSGGDYDVYVRDNAGNVDYCEAMFDINIPQDPPLTVTPTKVDVLCFGEATGSISISASGGNAPYLYSIDNGTNYQTGSDFVNLPAGTYNIRVQDSEGCEEPATVTIVQPDQIVAEAALTQNYTCLQLGEITVGSITPTTGGSGSYQYRLNGGAWSAATTGGIVYSDLTDGSYTVEVRDAAAVGCVTSLPAIVIPPLPTEPTLSTAVSYNCDGTGEITVLPADPSYTYSLNGGAFQASNVFSNVAAGNHTVTVNYGLDCEVSAGVYLAPDNAFNAAVLNTSDPACNGDNTGVINFEVENFDAVNGFEYSVNGGAFSAPQFASPVTLNGLIAGAYSIEVRNVTDTSCTITLTTSLTEPTPVVAAALPTQEITCTNSGGTITASASGGTGPYEYQLEDGVGGILVAYQSNTIFTSLSAGDYIVRVRDANGCIDPIDVPITLDPAESIVFTATPTACYSGNNDAIITVDVTSGNGNYQFSLDGGPWMTPSPTTATTYVFANLVPGTYTIDVKDQYGCTGVPVNVTINPQLLTTAVLVSDLTCLAPATIDVNATGGSGSYSYEWSDDGGATYNSTGFTGNTFTTNTSATYQFRVTDTTAPSVCITTTNSVFVTPTETPIITSVSPTDILCNGDLSGILDVVIDTSVGLPPYTINVFETITSTDYGTQTTGLPAGSYEVTITDDKGCVSAPFPVVINQPDPITYTPVSVPITCDTSSGTNPGSISITAVAGGTSEYTYFLRGNNGYSATYNTVAGGEDHTFTILEFGIYEIDIVDANGCAAETVEVIASPPDDLDIDVSTATVSCAAGGTAIVTVSSAVGSGDYQFGILDSYAIPYSSSFQGPDVLGGDTATFNNLVPGVTYTFVVYDNVTTCYYFESATGPIDTPSNMTVTSLAETNITCNGAADGSVSFTIDNYDAGATDVQYEIFDFQSNTTTGISGTVATTGSPITVSNVGPLDLGQYYILLTEVGGLYSGCSVGSADFPITESPVPLVITAASTENDNCNVNAGVITATAQYGTAPYEFQYLLDTDPAPVATDPGWTSSTFANVEAGDYRVYVKDAFGCIQFDDVTVNLDPSPAISLAIVDECVDEGNFEVLITLTAAGISPYQLSVNGGAYQNITFDGSNQYTVSGLSSGLGQSFSVRDVNGCIDTQTIDIYPPLQFTVIQTVLLDCEPGAAANAELVIEVLSGSGNYEFEIDGPGLVDVARTALPANPYTWTGASSAGTYAVSVYDMGTAPPNCVKTLNVEVPDALLPEFTETPVDVSCNGGSDGQIIISEVDTGVNPLTYTISPVAGTFNAATTTFENLPAGTYDITGTGTNSCPITHTVTINEPNIIVLPAPIPVFFACTTGNNPNNASITIDEAGITGGSGDYTIFEFINDQGTATTADDVTEQSGTNPQYIITNPAGGSYTINVYDSNGCMATTTQVIPPYDQIINATAAVTSDLTCVPGLDGQITVTVTSTLGDPSRFEYSIDGGTTYQVSNVFPGLDEGNYSIIVRHVDTGCEVIVNETISAPNEFDIQVNTLQNVICFGTTTGEVTFEFVDSVYSGDFDWTIYDINGTPANTADDIIVTSGNTPVNTVTAIVTLDAGEYRVEAVQTTAPQCTDSEFFNIAGPDTSLNGLFQFSEITCLGNDGSIEIYNVQGGWGGYTYYVGTVSPTGPGDYIASPLFENLGPGTYEIWVIDQQGCPEQIGTQVLADPLPIVGALQINQENCTNLQGEIEVVGVLNGQGSNYTYQLIKDGSDFGPPQSNPVFSGLGAGTYEVRISDQWSCSTVVGPETLYEEMTATAAVVKPIDCTVTPDGEVTITVNGGSANLEYTVTFPDGTTTQTNTTGVFTGLSQVGTYGFVVLDLDTTPNCSETVSLALDAPTPVTFDPPSITDVSCAGGSDGVITINLEATSIGINDNPPYTYTLTGPMGTVGPQASPTFTGLIAGSYVSEVSSDRGCISTQNIPVAEPNPLSVVATATTFACNPDNTVSTATITATVPVGAGTTPYLYSIDNINFQTANTFEIIDNGSTQTITVYVQDANGCVATDSVIIEPLNTFTATVTQNVAISCTNPEEVLITVADNGNPANTYTFEVLPLGNPDAVFISNPTNTTAIFELASIGSYVFRITDNATGCFVETVPYDIAPYDLIDIVATAATPVSCYGGSDGSISVDISNYTGNYDYEVFFSDGSTTGIIGSGDTGTNPLVITGLSGGNYYVQITETSVPLCQNDSNTVTIGSPDRPLDAPFEIISEVACTNDQGMVRITVDGGTAPYVITLTNNLTSQVYTGNTADIYVFDGLSAGNFTYVVTDANNCPFPGTFDLIEPMPLDAEIRGLQTNLTCYGDSNGIIEVYNVVGGTGSYLYELQEMDASGTTVIFTGGGQTNPIFTGLGAGIYRINVVDDYGCMFPTETVTITEPTEVMASLVQTAGMTCFTDAEIVLTASGGTGPYEFSVDNLTWSPMSGGTTHTFSVTEGVYQYYVRDANSCEANISNQVDIEEVPELILTLDDSAAMVNCTGEATATIYASAIGGLGNYSFELYSDAGLTNLLAGPQNSGEFSNLSVGTYFVRVISADCEDVESVPVSEPPPLVIEQDTFTDVTCFGEDNGTITVEVSGGTGTIYYAISPNLNQFDTVNTFTDLAPGLYQVIAQDENGCFIPFDYEIEEPNPVVIDYVSTPEVCAGTADGIIDIVISGGTAPYRTAFNSNADADFGPAQLSYTDLAPGTYVIFVRDANDCPTNQVIEVLPGVNINAVVTPMYECTGNIPDNYLDVQLEDPSVENDVMYALDSGAMQLEPSFTNMTPGPHVLTIAHANGCVQTFDFEIEAFEPLTLVLEQNNINEITAIAEGGVAPYTFFFNDHDNGEDNTYFIRETGTYTVTVIDQNGCEAVAEIFMEFIDIELPNFFTPDGDGMNDTWIPENIEGWPQILIKIFDRYGREVARVPYGHQGWDGTYNGTDLPTGDYWYIIKLNGENDDREFVGHFTLYR